MESGSIWKCETVFKLAQKNGWISELFAPIYNKNGSVFLILVPSMQTSLNKSFQHIGRKEVSGDMKMLTSGTYVVTEILAWDEDVDVVYFMRTGDNEPGNRHLYSVDRNASLICYTCLIKVRKKRNKFDSELQIRIWDPGSSAFLPPWTGDL
jgi:dipeptidyl-peptidase 4